MKLTKTYLKHLIQETIKEVLSADQALKPRPNETKEWMKQWRRIQKYAKGLSAIEKVPYNILYTPKMQSHDRANLKLYVEKGELKGKLWLMKRIMNSIDRRVEKY